MEPTHWLSIAAICLMGAASPGPSLAVVVRNTVAGGRGQGMRTGLGHGLGVGIYAFGAVIGVSALVQTLPGLSRGIEIAGGIYLIWLGIGALRRAGQPGEDGHLVSTRTGFSEGFAIAFLNPKIAVFFLALLGSMLPPGATTVERAGVAGMAMVIDGAWYVFAALLLVTTGAAEWLAARGHWLDRLLGVMLLGVGSVLLLWARG